MYTILVSEGPWGDMSGTVVNASYTTGHVSLYQLPEAGVSPFCRCENRGPESQSQKAVGMAVLVSEALASRAPASGLAPACFSIVWLQGTLQGREVTWGTHPPSVPQP